MKKWLFTSESVTEGHPDKVADQISDSILDAILQQDPMGRVACETSVTTGLVFIMGEISTKAYIDIPKVARKTIEEIGYNDPALGFEAHSCGVMVAIDEQSPDIAMGVDKSLEAKEGKIEEEDLSIGAGDQGMMFGFACNETQVLMPMPIYLAHELTKGLAKLRKEKVLPYLRPDGKAQVTVLYENNKPVKVETVVVSTQHSPDVSMDRLRTDIIELLVKKIIPADLLSKDTKYYINPTGRFVFGGPAADSGLTGRKIIVDTYGGMARHGGGAFSGKDPTKVDRSATYAARWVAKNIVAAGLADKCEIQLAYAIGVAQPVSVLVDTFGTAKVDEKKIEKAVKEIFDLRPGAIIKQLDLRKPIYKKTAAYGHFGRIEEEFTWEKVNKVEELKSYFNLK